MHLRRNNGKSLRAAVHVSADACSVQTEQFVSRNCQSRQPPAGKSQAKTPNARGDSCTDRVVTVLRYGQSGINLRTFGGVL